MSIAPCVDFVTQKAHIIFAVPLMQHDLGPEFIPLNSRCILTWASFAQATTNPPRCLLQVALFDLIRMANSGL